MGGGEESDDVKSRRVIVEARAVCKINSKGLGCSKVSRGRAQVADQGNSSDSNNMMISAWNLQKGSEGSVAENGGTEARCPVCSRSFHSKKAMHGHMRCHPEREWRGINPPPSAKTASSSSVSQEIDGLSHSSMISTVVSSDTSPSQPPLRWTKTGRKGQNRIINKCRTCKKAFPTYQTLSGNRPSHSYKKSLDMENQYASSSHTSASKGEGLALGTSKQVVQKIHKCRTCNKTFPTGQALGGHQTTHRQKPTQLAAPKQKALILSAEASQSAGPRVFDFDLNDLPPMEEE